MTCFFKNNIILDFMRLLFHKQFHLYKNQIKIDEKSLNIIRKSLYKNYYKGWRNQNNFNNKKFDKDFSSQLYKRLDIDRRRIVPWIDNVVTLKNKRILEIGCGTGSSTLALAEQGAMVTAIDVDEDSLLVAKDRSKAYGVKADFIILNANEISKSFNSDSFDIIIFFACLEHMTIEERLTSLKDSWEMLLKDGLLIIAETPNRLWYADAHTSELPFFNWLPDELAFYYSKFSLRDNYRELYREFDAQSLLHFIRRGRGMSFHELEIAIGTIKNLNVISSLSSFEGIKYKLKQSKNKRKYKSFLMNIYPNVHQGFFDETLYLIIRKN